MIKKTLFLILVAFIAHLSAYAQPDVIPVLSPAIGERISGQLLFKWKSFDARDPDVLGEG